MADKILRFSIDGTDLTARRVRAHFALGEPFAVMVDAHETSASAPPPEDRLGLACVVTIAAPDVEPFVVHGIVFEVVSALTGTGELPHHVFEVRPAAYALSIGRDHRYFQEMTSVEIAKAVLAKATIDQVSWSINGSPRKHDYVAQQGESDWDFILRILAEDGITYRFDFEEDATKLVFFDDNGSAPDISGGSVTYHRGSGMGQVSDAVHDLSRRTQLTHDHVVLRDYNPEKPQLDLEVKAEGEGSTRGFYDFPGRYETTSEGKTLAKHRLEALCANGKVLKGKATGFRLRPGSCMTIDQAPDFASDKLFLTRVDLDLEEKGSGLTRRQVSWEAIPATVPHRPRLREYAPLFGGPQTAAMVGPSGKEVHTDDAGRIRAQFWWDREGKKDEKASTWMRVGQFPLGGSMVRPRIGWDLLVEHQGGDGDLPLALSHLYDGTHPPPYSLPGDKTRTAWKTATVSGSGANEIRFEDKKGSEEIFLNASKDMAVTVGDKKTKTVGANHELKVGANREVEVGGNRTAGIKADQKVTVGAAEMVKVSGARNTGVKGKESITIGAARTVTAVKGKSLDADGGRTLTVGGSCTAVSAMDVARTVLGSASVTVGGSWICAAASGLDNNTVGAGSETVGAAKLQVGAKGVGLTCKGALAETVGAAYVTTAGGNFGETAKGKLSIKVGGAFLMTSPAIEIEAESEIKITCGGSSITIKSDSIEIKSPAIPAPGATITKTGGKIQHNP